MAFDTTMAAAFAASRVVVSAILPPALTLPLTAGSLLLPTEFHLRVM
ncbi:MAG: hypothetical protein AB7Q29_18420 [Vicinamibacterales bacterium]